MRFSHRAVLLIIRLAVPPQIIGMRHWLFFVIFMTVIRDAPDT